jgi:hypothetical protein
VAALHGGAILPASAVDSGTKDDRWPDSEQLPHQFSCLRHDDSRFIRDLTLAPLPCHVTQRADLRKATGRMTYCLLFRVIANGYKAEMMVAVNGPYESLMEPMVAQVPRGNPMSRES